mgnify:CR=1 FL=1
MGDLSKENPFFVSLMVIAAKLFLRPRFLPSKNKHRGKNRRRSRNNLFKRVPGARPTSSPHISNSTGRIRNTYFIKFER